MPNRVAARFYVASITRHAYNPGAGQVVLRAVSRGPENATWAAATPTGTIDLTVGNEGALATFADALGKEVLITFDVDAGDDPNG